LTPGGVPGAGRRFFPDYTPGCTTWRSANSIEWFGLEALSGFTKATVKAWLGALEARGLGSVFHSADHDGAHGGGRGG